MLTFFAGLGLTLAVLFVVFSTVILCAGLIATVRAAINPELGNFGKIVWILANLFIPGAAFLYFAFVDRNGFLKFTGWACLLAMALAALTGGAAMKTGYDALAHSNFWSYEIGPVDKEAPQDSPDDSSVDL